MNAGVQNPVISLGAMQVSMAIKKKNDQTVLKYVEPASPMWPDQGGELVTTMTLQKHQNSPFLQTLMDIKKIYDAKPVAIHILGKPAVGDLKHPFKAAAAGQKTDAAAIAEAEKKIGKNEE